MYTRHRPAPGERADRKRQLKYCNERSDPNMNLLHWSRRPSQRQAEPDLLAVFNLGFQKIPGTTFWGFCRRGE